MLRIKEAREARGWTQEHLAAEMHTTQQTVQRWESGQTDPKSSAIIEISRILGITVSFIMNVDDTQPQNSGLTDDEQRLVSLYRKLDEGSKKAVLAVADTLLMGQENGMPSIKNVKVEND